MSRRSQIGEAELHAGWRPVALVPGTETLNRKTVCFCSLRCGAIINVSSPISQDVQAVWARRDAQRVAKNFSRRVDQPGTACGVQRAYLFEMARNCPFDEPGHRQL